MGEGGFSSGSAINQTLQEDKRVEKTMLGVTFGRKMGGIMGVMYLDQRRMSVQWLTQGQGMIVPSFER
jgi:hypothetical protein